MFLAIAPAAQPSPEKLRAVNEATVEQRRAVSLRPHDATAYAELGHAYQMHKFLRAASEAWQTAVQLKPTDADAYRNYGMTIRATGDTAAAVRAYDSALVLRPADGQTYFNYGNVLTGTRERIDAFRNALRQVPAHFGARQNLVGALNGEKRHEEALEVMRDWARIDPETGERRLAEKLLHDGRKLEAAWRSRPAETVASHRACGVRGEPGAARPSLGGGDGRGGDGGGGDGGGGEGAGGDGGGGDGGCGGGEGGEGDGGGGEGGAGEGGEGS